MIQQFYSWVLSKENKTLIRKVICTRMFIVALFTIATIWKQPKCPSRDEWIKKMYVCVHTHTHTHNTGILLSHKNEILPFMTTCMDLECIMLSEINQTEKDKYCKSSLICGIWKQNNWRSITNRVVVTENKQVVARGDVGGGETGERGWDTNFQQQNKWVMGMKCTVWEI